MTKKQHRQIYASVKHAHPNYSDARAERETNAVMTNIGKGYVKKGKHMQKARKTPRKRRKS